VKVLLIVPPTLPRTEVDGPCLHRLGEKLFVVSVFAIGRLFDQLAGGNGLGYAPNSPCQSASCYSASRPTPIGKRPGSRTPTAQHMMVRGLVERELGVARFVLTEQGRAALAALLANGAR
jgi:hypothetical protein